MSQEVYTDEEDNVRILKVATTHCPDDCDMDSYREGFKDGYRKAQEELKKDQEKQVSY